MRNRNAQFLIVLLFAVTQVAIGVYVIVISLQQRDDRHNSIAYQACKARYDQNAAESFKILSDSSQDYQTANSVWTNSLTPLYEGHATKKNVKHSKQALHDLNAAFEDLMEARKINNSKPTPVEVCGDPGPIPEKK